VFSSYLTGDNQVDNFTDESRSAFIDADGSGGFSQNDILVGMIRFSNANPSGQAPNQNISQQLSIVFSATITAAPTFLGGTGTGPDPLRFSYTLGPTDPTNAMSLPKLLDDSVQGGIADGDAIWNSAIGVLLENPSTTANPIAFPGATVAAQMANFTSANGWSFDLLAGFDQSGTNRFGDTDVFEATANIVTSGPTAGHITGNEAGGFSVLAGFPSALLLPVDLIHVDATTMTSHDVTLDYPDTVYKNFGSPAISAPWTFSDQSSFSINPMPEPVSALIWLGLVSVFGCVASSRRR
jgi:hypothetical protein